MKTSLHQERVGPLGGVGAVLPLMLLCIIGGGCSIFPPAQPDPSRFYVLASSATGLPPQGAPALRLRSVEVASYLRGRPLVLRRGEHEIEFREHARWGEPLEQGVARLLQGQLAALGIAMAMPDSGRRETVTGESTLVVRILACEGGAGGEVLFRATWELTPAAAKAGPSSRGEFRATDLRWDGKTEASLVAQLSAAVNGLAGDIATALKK